MPRNSLFGSIKKLARNNSSKLDSAAMDNSNRGISSPPTRRPPEPRRNPLDGNPDDPPPAYTATAPAGGQSTMIPTITTTPPTNMRPPSPARSARSGVSTSSRRSIVAQTPEDPHAFLSSFDTVFVIDDSGSMAGRSWREASQAIKFIAPICTAHDADGIDVYFLNHKSSDPGDAAAGAAAGGYRNVRNQADVEHIFKSVRPQGGTPTGTRCQNILKPYLARLNAIVQAGEDIEDADVKPLNIIVITDGVPSDDVESVLLAAAKKLDRYDAPPYQVGVQFFQVGNEEGAREALRELDDNLSDMIQGGVRDMVDTVTWTGGPLPEGQPQTAMLTGESILKAVLGAVVKRLDRRRTSGEQARP